MAVTNAGAAPDGPWESAGGGTNDLHPMGAPELGVLGWHCVRLGDRIEEGVHRAGGGERNQEPAGSVPNEMRMARLAASGVPRITRPLLLRHAVPPSEKWVHCSLSTGKISGR